MRKRIFCGLLAAALVWLLCACGGSKAPTWQEQYELGVRYLTEGNYQEAVIAFTAAIEIDPKQADAYLGLADAYLGLGDREQALAALRQGLAAAGASPALEERLAELEPAAEPEPEAPEDGGGPETVTYPLLDHRDRVSWEYIPGGELVSENEGAVGELRVEYWNLEVQSGWDAEVEIYLDGCFLEGEREIQAAVQELVEDYKCSLDFDSEMYQRYGGGRGFGFPIWPEDLGKVEILVVEFGKKEPGQEVPVLGYMLFENVVIG